MQLDFGSTLAVERLQLSAGHVLVVLLQSARFCFTCADIKNISNGLLMTFGPCCGSDQTWPLLGIH